MCWFQRHSYSFEAIQFVILPWKAVKCPDSDCSSSCQNGALRSSFEKNNNNCHFGVNVSLLGIGKFDADCLALFTLRAFSVILYGLRNCSRWLCNGSSASLTCNLTWWFHGSVIIMVVCSWSIKATSWKKFDFFKTYMKSNKLQSRVLLKLFTLMKNGKKEHKTTFQPAQSFSYLAEWGESRPPFKNLLIFPPPGKIHRVDTPTTKFLYPRPKIYFPP